MTWVHPLVINIICYNCYFITFNSIIKEKNPAENGGRVLSQF